MKNEHIENGEQYPLEIKDTMDSAEKRMERRVAVAFSKWNYEVFQWAVNIIQDFTGHNEVIKKSEGETAKALVPTESQLTGELAAIIVVDDFLVDNTVLAMPMQKAVSYSFNTMAADVGSKSMASSVLAAMNLSFDIQYDMNLYNRILEERKLWLAEELYDTTLQRIPEIISKGIEKGSPIDDMTKAIQDVLGMDKDRATKIARTETNFAVNEAIREQTHTLGIMKYRISTAVDACDLCRMAAESEYTYKEAQGLLPLHPNDRCVLQSIIPDSWLGIKKSISERGIQKTIDKGYVPIKGMDYFTEDEIDSIKKDVTPKRGKDYLTKSELEEVKKEIAPKKGIDYLVEEEIAKIKKEITPRKGIDYVDGKDGRSIRGKKGDPGKDGSPDTPEEIKGKLESLKGEKRLSASAIKGLDETLEKKLPKIIMTGSTESGKVRVEGVGEMDYLENKIEAGTNVTVTKIGDKLVISSTGGDGSYTLPIATDTLLGGIKIGDRLTIDANGVLSADVQGGATGVVTVVAGTDISVDSTDPENPIVSFSGTIPTDTGDLTNGAGFVTSSDIPAIPEDISELTDTTGLLGNATKIQGFDVTTTDPTDGKILVYRTATNEYVLEDKPAAGANPSAADVSFTPTGDLAADDVQEALAELDTEKASRSFVVAMSVAL